MKKLQILRRTDYADEIYCLRFYVDGKIVFHLPACDEVVMKTMKLFIHPDIEIEER